MPDARSRGRSEGLPPNSPRTTVLIYVAIIPGTGQSPGGGKQAHLAARKGRTGEMLEELLEIKAVTGFGLSSIATEKALARGQNEVKTKGFNRDSRVYNGLNPGSKTRNPGQILG